MSENYALLAAHNKWQPDNALARLNIPPCWQSWLFDKGSLTVALSAFSKQDFQVNVLKQAWQRPYFHEGKKLALKENEVALIREVELLVDKQAVVFARSVIPQKALSGQGRGLSGIGSKPLGHLLFKDGKMRVSKREFACLDYKERAVYARRTPYQYLNNEILVSEFFICSQLILPQTNIILPSTNTILPSINITLP